MLLFRQMSVPAYQTPKFFFTKKTIALTILYNLSFHQHTIHDVVTKLLLELNLKILLHSK